MSNITPEKYRRKVTAPHSDVQMTEQSHKDECDINNILARYKITGHINHIAKAAPMYADFTGVSDFREMMERVTTAQTLFETVPSGIRTRFNNNPAEYLEFMMNRDNLAEIQALNLPVEHFNLPPATPVAAPLPNEPTAPV